LSIRVPNDLEYLDLENKGFSSKQLNNLDYNLNRLSIKNLDYIDSFEGLVKKLKSSYIHKSSKLLEYFVKNNLKTKNIRTKKVRDYTFSNGVFKYANDFYYDVDTNNIKNSELKFREHKQGEFLSNKDRLYSNKKIAKTMYLDYVNQDKKKVFITFTLPNKKFHKYDKKGIPTSTFNSKDKLEENIERGLKYLNEIHRYFYHTLKYKVMRYCKSNNITNKEVINIDFIKILEPHKSLDGHLHSLFYINEEFLEIIEEVYNMTKKQFNLIETKFEILEKAKASTYLNKYLLKTTKSGNLFYNQYKRYFSKTRFFTSSNFRHTNQEKIEIVYKFLKEYKPKLFTYFRKSEIPLYFQLEQLILKNYFRFEEEIKIRKTICFKAIEKEFEELENKEDIESFKKSVLDNIDNYTTTYKAKTIQKVYFKKWLIYNRKYYEKVPIYGYEFEKLKVSIFENEEDEIKAFNKFDFY
jgi:hypothetical protein